MCEYCKFFKEIGFEITLLENFKAIYVLVSGGVDSTLLAEYISSHFPEKTFFVNCYNPYEMNKTLLQFRKQPNFLEIRPGERLHYAEILKESFMKLPLARKRREQGHYDKKIFPCCKHIKKTTFKLDPRFKGNEIVIVSGIKSGDGQQRAFFLKDLRKGSHPRMKNGIPTFFWTHKTDNNYCYPFRDYFHRELPNDVMDRLKLKYPYLQHSGCRICPIVVLFELKHAINYESSIKYWNKISGQKTMDDFIGKRI